MSKIKTFTLEVNTPVYADLSEHNERIVETAGFIPLDVKFKRFEQAGIAAQFSTSEFTANDYRELYANPDFAIYPDDEFEEVQEKIKALEEFRAAYIQSKKLGDLQSKSPSQQAERASGEKPKSDMETESE